MTKQQIEQLIAPIIPDNLDKNIVFAIIEVESSWNPWAVRAEPGYRWVWDVKKQRPFRKMISDEISNIYAPSDFPSFPGCTRDTEWLGQKSSWGLMQIMGAVAREYGFTDTFLSELVDPVVNVSYGCMHLSRYVARLLDKHGWPAVVASYNAGISFPDQNGQFRNQDYVNKVYKVYQRLASRRI